VLAWAASRQIYDPVNPKAKVAKVIGGNVARNINMPPPYTWENTCAVRMSYILNRSGMAIPYVAEKTVSGLDKRWYFYRVKALIEFLIQRWGKPDLVVTYPPAGGGPLNSRRGIILFEISGWGDAGGHATLWDGNLCYDHCYFNEPETIYRTSRANFWSLP
jgi:hypothetical protein